MYHKVTVQGKSKLMEGDTKLGFPFDCHSLQSPIELADSMGDSITDLLPKRQVGMGLYNGFSLSDSGVISM